MQDNNLFASAEERLKKQVYRMSKLKNEHLEKQPFTTDVWLKSVYVQKGLLITNEWINVRETYQVFNE